MKRLPYYFRHSGISSCPICLRSDRAKRFEWHYIEDWQSRHGKWSHSLKVGWGLYGANGVVFLNREESWTLIAQLGLQPKEIPKCKLLCQEDFLVWKRKNSKYDVRIEEIENGNL